MSNWKRTSDDYEEGVIYYESGELVANGDSKKKEAERKLRTKIKNNLKVIEDYRGLKYSPTALNADTKTYQQLLLYGWSHESIMKTYLDTIDDPHWKEEKIKGKYPSMQTVEYRLRNKQPK